MKKIKLVLSPIKSFIVGFATLLVIRVINRGDVVLLTNSLGDDVYGLSLLGDFKKSRNRKLTVIGLISRKKLIEFYRDSFDRMILLEIESSNWRRIVIIWRIRILMKIGQILNIYSMCPFHWLPEDRIEGRDVISVLRDEILKLPPRVNVVTPDFASEPITSIQDFDEICNRIVVLNPYSTTMRDISWSMFEEIAKFLKAKGYIVYTNIWRGDNKVIPGTQSLDCSVYEFYAICNRIPLVASVRTGLLDFCISCNTQFVVFYFPIQDRMFEPLEWFYKTYTLSAWKTNNVTELIYKDNESSVEAVSKLISRI